LKEEMAKLTEELAEAKAISEREVSLRDGKYQQMFHYFTLSVILGSSP